MDRPQSGGHGPAPETVTHVVGTAGHVDHGKSALVRALTGTDPDRLPEERRRGLTIDLGFAVGTLPSGRGLSFVDVPGHADFLPNMLAGVGGVDACLFVVDASEGWRAQSEEHLRILEVLGVAHGVVAVTKVDLVDDDHLGAVTGEIAERLAGSPLSDAPVVSVSTRTGTGLPALRTALDTVLADAPRAVDVGRPRLWIDRSFTISGAGTVVTGTLTGGWLTEGDAVGVVPGGDRARIRSLESHGHRVATIGPGHRVAVNLAGASRLGTPRGAAVVEPGRWHAATTVDASLRVLGSLRHDLSRRGAYHLHVGTAELSVRLRVLGREVLAPGTTGFVRLHLPHPLPLVPGDRYVLREAGRSETVGGGTVLDVDPRSRAAEARPDPDPAAVVAARRWVDVDDLERLTGRRYAPTVGHWVVDPAVLAQVRRTLTDAVATAGAEGLPTAGLDDLQRAVLSTLDEVEVDGGRARPAGAGGPTDSEAARTWLAALDAEPFTPPPPPADLDGAELRRLAERARVVGHDGIWFSVGAVDAAARRVAALLVRQPDGVGIGAIRDALDTSRKYVVPLLAILDGTGRTRRRGDLRIAGPRLPEAPRPED